MVIKAEAVQWYSDDDNDDGDDDYNDGDDDNPHLFIARLNNKRNKILECERKRM